MKSKKIELVDAMAQLCHYAQDHVSDSEAWSHKKENLAQNFTCVDFQIACFLAQNTKNGNNGVGCGIVIDELCEMPPKSIKAWKKIIEKEVVALGGFIK